MTYPNSRFYNFTLVELLIVISVIAILTSMLLPALKKAQETAKGIACLNNMKQIGIALHSYIGDYDNQMLPSYQSDQSSLLSANWTYKLIPYLKANVDSDGHYYVGDSYYCATDQSPFTHTGYADADTYRYSYGYNETFGHARMLQVSASSFRAERYSYKSLTYILKYNKNAFVLKEALKLSLSTGNIYAISYLFDQGNMSLITNPDYNHYNFLFLDGCAKKYPKTDVLAPVNFADKTQFASRAAHWILK